MPLPMALTKRDTLDFIGTDLERSYEKKFSWCPPCGLQVRKVPLPFVDDTKPKFSCSKCCAVLSHPHARNQSQFKASRRNKVLYSALVLPVVVAGFAAAVVACSQYVDPTEDVAFAATFLVPFAAALLGRWGLGRLLPH